MDASRARHCSPRVRLHRTLECELIEDYEKTVGEPLEGQGTENIDLTVSIANVPKHIRGSDTSEEQQLKDAGPRGRSACRLPVVVTG